MPLQEIHLPTYAKQNKRRNAENTKFEISVGTRTIQN